MTLWPVTYRSDSIVNLSAANIAGQESVNITENISRIENTERSFLDRLRAFRDRARCVLSNAWQWLRNNVFRCCCSSATDNLEEETPIIAQEEAVNTSIAAEEQRLSKFRAQLNLPEALMDPQTIAIVDFFYDQQATPKGTKFSDLLNLSEQELRAHSVDIKYLFPVREKEDQISFNSLIATDNTRQLLSINSQLRELYLQGVEKMLGFWQLRLNSDGLIETAPDFNYATCLWLKKDSDLHRKEHMVHMLKSLATLGFERMAQSLQKLILQKSNHHGVLLAVNQYWIRNLGAMVEIPIDRETLRQGLD